MRCAVFSFYPMEYVIRKQRTEIRRRKTENRRQKTEIRKQKTEDRRQMSEIRKRETENGKRKSDIEAVGCHLPESE